MIAVPVGVLPTVLHAANLGLTQGRSLRNDEAMAKPPDPLHPVPGYYLLRFVPKGWEVPCQIALTSYGTYRAEVDGELLGGQWTSDQLAEHWPPHSPSDGNPVLRIGYYGKPTTHEEYLYKTAYREWARENAPRHFCLRPTEPVDLRLLPADDF
jgi:hypothetical protein